MHTKQYQSLSIFGLSILVFLIARFQHNETPLDVANEFIANCKFSPPGDYRPGPYAKSIKWCENVDIKETKDLMHHMYFHSGDTPGLIASEFGSNVRIAYLTGKGMFLINPVILETKGKTVSCAVDLDFDREERIMKAESVLVSYKDEFFKNQETWFHRMDACHVQAMINNL